MFGFSFRRKSFNREIILNCESLEMRAAVLESGRLEEFQMEHTTEARLVGSIYKGKIQNLESGLQAAFVDIGLPKNAFLHYWDMIPEDTARLEAAEEGHARQGSHKRHVSHEEIARRFPVGSDIVVQVTKGPISTKGPRVTANLSVPGRYLVMMPGSTLKGVSRKIEDEKERNRLKKILARLPVPADMGLIIRTAGEGAKKRSFVRDVRGLLEIWAQVQQRVRDMPAPCCLYQEPDLAERVLRDWITEEVDRIVVDAPETYERLRDLAARISRRLKSRIQMYDGQNPVFEHFDIERQIEEAFSRKVTLKSGGHLVLEETEALVAIDVNTGRHKGASTQEEAILEVNLQAVEEAARQLRLRNLGGLIVIDLIDMKQKKNRNAVYKALRDALRRDKARTNVLPISSLGLLEMTRQRTEEGVMAAMYGDCPYCHGHGRVKSPLTMSVAIQRQIAAVLRRRGTGEGLRLQILVQPSVLERLRTEDEAILVDMQARFKGHLTFRADPSRHVEDFAIRNADTGEVLYGKADNTGP